MNEFIIILAISWLTSGAIIGMVNHLSFSRNEKEYGTWHRRNYDDHVHKWRWYIKDVALGILSVGSPSWDERYFMDRAKDNSK